MGLLFLLLLSPAAGALSVFAAGLPAQNPVQLLGAHLLTLRRLYRQPVGKVPQDAHAVLNGLEVGMGGGHEAKVQCI